MTDMDVLTLPLDYSAIERILPHRYPFLLVDRITEFDPDRRIVGVKNVSLNDRYLAYPPGERPVLPPTILTEAIAQVGAIMILAKPENRQRLPFFAGIERVRYRQAVHPGDVVEIEATVLRLRSRMGRLKGVARVDGQVVVEGIMTFALGPRGAQPLDFQGQSAPGATHVESAGSQWCGRDHQKHEPRLRRARRPPRPYRLRPGVAHGIEHRGREDQSADPRFVHAQRSGHAARVALRRAGVCEGGTAVGRRCDHVPREQALGERGMLGPKVRTPREEQLAGSVLHPESRRRDRELLPRVHRAWVIAKNGSGPNDTRSSPGFASKTASKSRWPASCAARPDTAPPRKVTIAAPRCPC